MFLRALGCAAAIACCLTVARPAVAGCGTCDKTVVENAANNADFSTLVAAVKAAGLAGTLSGSGPLLSLPRPTPLLKSFRKAPSKAF